MKTNLSCWAAIAIILGAGLVRLIRFVKRAPWRRVIQNRHEDL